MSRPVENFYKSLSLFEPNWQHVRKQDLKALVNDNFAVFFNTSGIKEGSREDYM